MDPNEVLNAALDDKKLAEFKNEVDEQPTLESFDPLAPSAHMMQRNWGL